MKSIPLFLVVLFTSLFTTAQQQRMAFASVLQAGLLSGYNGQAASLQTINGVQKGNWMAGVGVGIDFYGQRSVPLFASVHRSFGKQRKQVYAYVNGGVNFRWLEARDDYKRNYESSPGICYEGGVGWKVRAFGNGGVLISAGYSYKQFSEQLPMYMWLSMQPLNGQPMATYTYQLRRIVLRLGIQL